VDLSQQDLVINMRVASEEEVFAPIGRVRDALGSLGSFSIQMIGRPVDQEFSLKVPSAGGDDTAFLQEIEAQVVELLGREFGPETVILKKTEFIGSLFSADLVRSAVWSFVVALVLILVYVTVRFKFVFAVSAILALIHDVAIMIGVIAVAQLELSSATIAAFLTIIGYSLNDTIVVFDRIRENTALMPESDRETIINTSITQSLSRTTITSLTTLLAVTAIYVFASGAIKIFALNLIVGVVVGTYSSIFIASPVVLGWMNLLDRRKKRGRRAEPVLKLVTPQKGKEEKAAGDRAAQERAAQEERIVSQIQAAAESRKSGGSKGRIQPTRKKRKKKKR
jgi:preprotein translocase subunit SecF